MNRSEVEARARQWLAEDPDSQTREELTQLLGQGAQAENELADRFAGALEFGTAGLRGVLGAGSNRMNRSVIRRTTAGLARYLKTHVPDVRARGVVVGRDGRRMSREFADEAAGVLAAEGIPVWFFSDLAPTPVTAFATVKLGAAAGVMVTASHNPPEYNGYKVYWGNGAQIIPPHDGGIAAEIDRVEPANQVRLISAAEARTQGLLKEPGHEIGRSYLDAILNLRIHRRGTPELKIVYSAMHGVGGVWAKSVLEEAGFTVHVVPEQQEPDGRFPTVRFPNPEEPGAMDLSRALAERVGADLVLANDPDADRLAVLVRDRRGAMVALTGNEVGVLLGHYLLTQRSHLGTRPLVITTIVSSLQLRDIAQANGALYDGTLTGFKWIANRAMERERTEGASFVFGYEEALGYSVGPVVRDKDGIGAAVVFADLASWCRDRGATVSDYLEEIQRAHGLFVSEQKNFTLPGAEGAAVIARVMEAFRISAPARIGGLGVAVTHDYQLPKPNFPPSNVIAYELEGGARITLRPSGTEPKIKYYFELKHLLRPGEAIDTARQQARQELTILEDEFLKLARERGQP